MLYLKNIKMIKTKVILFIILILLSTQIVFATWFSPKLPPPTVVIKEKWMYINMESSIYNPVLWNMKDYPDTPFKRYHYITIPGRIYIITSGEVP